MNAIILEDEKLSADHLVNLLHKLDPQILITGIFDSVKRSVEAFRMGMTADLMFADIRLADGLSFEIFEAMNINIPVIFTTAYDEFALKAFRLNSVDYLLKPVGQDELSKALEKFRKFSVSLNPEQISNIMNAIQSIQRRYKSRFMIRLGENIFPVPVSEVVHFLSDDPLVILVTKSHNNYPVDFTLDQLQSLLDPVTFFRINRKVIVNIDSIKKISAYFNNRLKLTAVHLSEENAIVSRERVNDFKSWLGK